MKKSMLPALIALSLLVGLFAFGPSTALGAPNTTFTVNSANDVNDGKCNGAHCSLREAILASNAAGNFDMVEFEIGGCPCIIYPQTELPEITAPVLINGYSEDGAEPGNGSGPPVLVITLRGTLVGGFPSGLKISAGESHVRGLVINDFGGPGIWLLGKGANIIRGNFIGIFASGTAASPNGKGILVNGGSNENIIGGPDNADRNVISGNIGAGIEITSSAEGGSEANVINGNRIGINQHNDPMGNGIGILIRTPKNRIGSNKSVGVNRISANIGPGIKIEGPNANGNKIFGSVIGSADDAIPGNGTYGILLADGASKNKIGGAHAPNYILRNNSDGIAIVGDATQRNQLLDNLIYLNGGLGIDLGDDGTSSNDALDSDSGPNKRQNFPIIKTASAATNRIKGVLKSAPNTTYRIQLHYNPICDSSGYGEGAPLHTVVVTTNSLGRAAFDVVVELDLPGGIFVFATATDPKGNTSEFSKCKIAV
jgi:titin